MIRCREEWEERVLTKPVDSAFERLRVDSRKARYTFEYVNSLRYTGFDYRNSKKVLIRQNYLLIR